jgi:hypothetical protein
MIILECCLFALSYPAFRQNELLAPVRIQFTFSAEIKGERLVDSVGSFHGAGRRWRPTWTRFRAVTYSEM